MPTGPKGEKRPADPIANALLVAKIATGEAEETYVNAGQRAGGMKGGKKGGATRAKRLSAERRSEIAKKAAAARWASA